MLTTEPLGTANIVDVPADLFTPFDFLTNSNRPPGPASPAGCICTGRLFTVRIYGHIHGLLTSSLYGREEG